MRVFPLNMLVYGGSTWVWWCEWNEPKLILREIRVVLWTPLSRLVYF